MAVADTLSIKIDDKERDLFMSFGLLNELSTLVDDPAKVPGIPVDPVLRSKVLAACFAERKKSGKIENPVDIDDVDVSIADAEKTIDWAMENLISFFVRALKKVVALTEANKKEMESLSSSFDGLKASPSKNP